MMGPAPAGESVKPPPRPAPLPTTPAAEAAKVEPIPMKATTDEDIKLYLKQGDRDPKWDEFIAPAFESFDKERFATAGIFLNKAYELGCRDPLVLFRLGIYRESQDRTKEAADLMLEAAKGMGNRYPGHPLAQAVPKHAGRALYTADRVDEALPYLEKALALEPDDFMLLLMIGQIDRMKKRHAKARDRFEKALAAGAPEGVTPDPKLTLMRELIIITYELEDYKACEGYVERVREIEPKDKVALDYNKRLGKRKQRQREMDLIKRITE